VTWLEERRDTPFPPADAFDDAVLDLGIDEPEYEDDEDRAGDLASASAAAAQLRRVGFRDVAAHEAWVEHRWDPARYLEYKMYDERDLMAALPGNLRRRLREDAWRRLQELPADSFAWQTPIVYAKGVRPG
jgi:hypothetical protein